MNRLSIAILIGLTLISNFINAQKKDVYVDSLNYILNLNISRNEKIDKLSRIAQYLVINHPNPDMAINYGTELLKLAQQEQNATEEAHALNILGLSTFFKSYDSEDGWNKALEYFNQSLTMAQKINNHELAANSYLGKAVLHEFSGKANEALSYYFLYRSEAEASGDVHLIIYSIQALANGYFRIYETEKAIELLIEGTERIQKLPKDKWKHGRIFCDLAYIYKTIKLLDEAKSAALEAVALFNSRPPNQPILNIWQEGHECYFRLAEVYLAIEKADSAKYYFLNTDSLFTKIPYSEYLGNVHLMHLAKIEKDNRNYDKAMTYVNRLKNDKAQVTSSSLGLMAEAFICYDLKEYRKALILAQEAKMNLADEGDLLMLLPIAAESAEILGMHQQAIAYYKELREIENRLHDGTLKARVGERNFNIKLKQKEALIQLEQERNANSFYQKIVLASALAVASLLMLFGWVQYRQKTKAMQALHEHREELQTTNNYLATVNTQLDKMQIRMQDSIDYASTIQQALLPTQQVLKKIFSEIWILYRPLHVVSGDFYWAFVNEKQSFLAAIDCTGHGVPGALMSLIANGLLTEIVETQGHHDPAMILERMDVSLRRLLHQEETDKQDGMDITLMAYEKQTNTLRCAAARNDLILINDDGLRIIPAAKRSLGEKKESQALDPFKTHTVCLEKPTMCYLFSDGYADQFGGGQKRKLGYKQMFSEFMDVYSKPAEEQSRRMEGRLNAWMGDQAQLDDILLIGIRIIPQVPEGKA